MHLRHALPTAIALTSFACVIDPGVLEGDEAASSETDTDADSDGTDSDSGSDSGETGETGEPGLAECLQGTNPQGGVDPGDFPLETCPAFVCDEGWGHGGATLPIAWTMKFAKPEPEQSRAPVGVVPRSQADGVLIVARRDAGPELSTVSAQGELLATTMLATSLWITGVEAGEGLIFLSAFDEQQSSSSVLAIDESGALLWSVPVEGSIQAIAALPTGGVVAALIQQGGGELETLTAAGMPDWTTPTLTPVGLGVSPAGRILVTGHPALEFTQHLMHLYTADGELYGEAEAPGMIGELFQLHFLDEKRVLASGSRFDEGLMSTDAVVQLLDFDTWTVWAHDYDRALDNCLSAETLLASGYPTWEYFEQIVQLADGSFLIAAIEEGEANYVMQPRVLHIDEHGELLASDRGLWSGQAKALAAAEDGSGYALLTIGGSMNYDGDYDGFYLRKYEP